jgi:hypothetical protein
VLAVKNGGLANKRKHETVLSVTKRKKKLATGRTKTFSEYTLTSTMTEYNPTNNVAAIHYLGIPQQHAAIRLLVVY